MYYDEIKKLSYEEWEFFAQDVLFYLGFLILEGPSEGPDAGLDLKVAKNGINYLVSCKHLNKNVGVPHEQDISDRLIQHGCTGFIAFYLTSPTKPLKTKLRKIQETGTMIIELCKDEILDIIPNMSGWILQKYFKRPHELHDHKNIYASYKPLICLENDCKKDLLLKDNINLSLASLIYNDETKEIDFVYGCKECINKYLNDDWEWIELTQARYIEQLLRWRELMDNQIKDGFLPSETFYKNWSNFQEAMFQILVPIGWGKWLPE